MHSFPPAFLFILGALLVPLLPKTLRSLYVIAIPVLGFLWVYNVPLGTSLEVMGPLGFELELLRVDRISKAFGYIFTLNATAAFIYAFYVKGWEEHTAALMYMGASLGVVFAGDLITLYLFWETMAVTSTFLILARRTKKSYAASMRYILVHIFGGLVLLFGIVVTIAQTGDTSFSAEVFTDPTLGSWLILAGILVNAAAPPLSSWLPDSYPEATITGGVILSAYTSKTAVYTLIRGFPGYEVLIIIGCVMAVYGIIYALLENDMRRILAYSIVNQVGFMVAAVGIGSEMTINGAVAHAFCHIIYKALLWMSAGVVLYLTTKTRCTDLGGLYKMMPWTMLLGVIGALAISSVPGTSGFTSKSLIVIGAAEGHYLWPWLILEIASAGVFLHAGIKFPYFVFFNFKREWGDEVHESNAPKTMFVAMGFLAFLCIFLGVYPDPLYAILPYQDMFAEGFTVWKAEKVVTQAQLLSFSGLVFFLFLPLLKRTNTIAIDFDWFYRVGGKVFYKGADKGLNGVNTWAHRVFITGLTRRTVRFAKRGPRRLFTMLVAGQWKDLPKRERRLKVLKRYRRVMLGAMPIGLSAFWAIILLVVLYYL